MSGRIVRQGLWNSIGNLKGIRPWIKAATRLELIVAQPASGSSHYSIHKQDFALTDVRGVVVTVYDGMSKQVNQKVFKRFLDNGFQEDQVWRALDMLK